MYPKEWRERRIAIIETKIVMLREFDGPGLTEGVKAGMIQALELCLARHQRDIAKQFDGKPTDLAPLNFAASARQTEDTHDGIWVFLSEENPSGGQQIHRALGQQQISANRAD